MKRNKPILTAVPVHIIAEAGSNHNGKIKYAKELVDIAKDAGADSVKFQMINTWGLYLPGKYEYGHYDIGEVTKFRLDCEFSDREYGDLARYCKERSIIFSASVFDEKSLDLLAKFNPPYVKIASCDLNNTRFLRKVAQKGIKMILSTGMSTLKDIEKTVKDLDRLKFNDIVLMHCVSVYPCALRQTNLNFIEELKSNFGFEVGFSDHTGDSLAACVALAKGATWFEKHFTLNKRLKGLDHSYALDRNELKRYVEDISDAAESLAPKKEKISGSEYFTRRRARRSLYAARDINPGETIKNEDVLIVRPENKMSADEIDRVVGKKMIKAVKKYQPFIPGIFK